jgi:hypothetical protein
MRLANNTNKAHYNALREEEEEKKKGNYFFNIKE